MPVNVRYVGHQPKKSSSRVNEKFNTVWTGHGDVQTVTDEEAASILRPQYSRIWQRVADSPKPTPAAEYVPPAAETNAGAAAEISEEDKAEAEAAAAAQAAEAASDKEITAEEVRERLVGILQVIPKLKTTDFDSQGRPKLTALRALLRRDVTAIERDAAWDLAKKKAGTPETPDEKGSGGKVASAAEEAETAPE